jgi:transposase-like protein
MPQNDHCGRSAQISGSGELFSSAKVEAVAVAIVTEGTLVAAAAAIGCDPSTLRVWRQMPEIILRVRQLRAALNDERLAKLRAREQEKVSSCSAAILRPASSFASVTVRPVPLNP